MKTLLAILAASVALSAVAANAAVVTHKPTKPVPSVSTYNCSNDLGYLRRVYEEQIDDILEVSIVPICEDDDYGLMRSDGNAGAIRNRIAENDDIMYALDGADYGIDDVVGVRMTGDYKAIIYVHTFLR